MTSNPKRLSLSAIEGNDSSLELESEDHCFLKASSQLGGTRSEDDNEDRSEYGHTQGMYCNV